MRLIADFLPTKSTAVTSWFFGPSLSDRILIYSGAECVASSLASHSLSGSPSVPDASSAHSTNDANHLLDSHHCYSQPDDIYLPNVFQDQVAKGASGASEGVGISSLKNTQNNARVYWRGGHDISGHVFLLTLASLFLITEIWPSLQAISQGKRISSYRRYTTLAVLTLVGLWWWMMLVGGISRQNQINLAESGWNPDDELVLPHPAREVDRLHRRSRSVVEQLAAGLVDKESCLPAVP